MNYSKTMVRLAGGAGALVMLASCHAPGASADAAPGAASNSKAGPPPIPAGEARKQLAELPIAVRGTMDGYDRHKKFPTWQTVSGGCNVRDEVLKRDGADVKVNARCTPISGTWHSLYDDQTWTKASDVDIDHVVPLGQAWVSGAKSWPQDKRTQLANDLTRPQLFAVTDNVNQQKSDKAPDQWKPPLVSFWCTYAADWIVVKRYYGLTATVPERTALSDMLNHC
jgi:hypothetical protein